MFLKSPVPDKNRIPESELVLNKDGSVYHLNLKPENIAETIITVGDPGRVYKISQHFEEMEFEMNFREFITHTGFFKGKRITVLSTGMGTDNIEIVLTELDALVNIDLKTRLEKKNKRRLKIIRLGTSGSLQEDIPVGSHLVSEYAIGFDMLMHFYNLTQTNFENSISDALSKKINLPFRPYCVKGSEILNEQFGFDMVQGNTVTCPGFYAPQGRKIRLELKLKDFMEELNYFHEENFWLTNFEMETAGYYAMGRLLGHEVISLNAIISNRIKNEFAENPNAIIDKLIKKVLNRI
ncbi:MAG: nucleoside phosphorylase [Bacteroidota bacterium]|jgi:uridine phosphorylase|nr:nucleoside phosphorylase [Bacteroidota bacterium]